MRPYLAIIKDSFREALASRVLWALIVIITLVLLSLAPLHWSSSIAADLTSGEIRNPRNFAAAIAVGADGDATPLQKHLWGYLSSRTKEWISEPNEEENKEEGESRRRRGGPPNNVIRETIAKDLNAAIKKDDFFDAQLWEGVTLPSRAQDLLQKGTLSGDEQQLFNRLALESALPGQILRCPDEAVTFRYAVWDMGFPSVRRQDAENVIDNLVVPFMSIFVGFFGVFSGVLVTAPIIPNMLNSGSLYVLLSKPIARPLLFLAKFLGGCSYVFINASYLIVGIWLLLGFRFGIWKPQILWSIPLFSFAFAIFYSVSALAGLVWRSAIMAVVATNLFWFLCFSVGQSKSLIELLVMLPTEITNIDQVGDHLIARRFNGNLELFDEETNDFTRVLANASRRGPGPPEVLMGARTTVDGLIHDKANDQLIVMDREWSKARIAAGSKESGYRRDRTITPPRNSRGLFLHDQQPIVVADGGVFPLNIETEEPAEENKGTSIFGLFTIPPLPTKEKPVEKISSDLGPLPRDVRVDYDPSTKSLYLLGGDSLRRWQPVEGVFEETKSIELELSRPTHFVARGGRIAVTHEVSQEGTSNEEAKPSDETDQSESEWIQRISLYDAELDEIGAIDVDGESKVSELKLSADGIHVALLQQNEELQLFRLNDRSSQPEVTFQKEDVSSFGFTDDQLLITDNVDQISKYALSGFALTQKIKPNVPFMKRLYQSFVNPVYLMFPKPGELDKTMRYLITGKDSLSLEQLGPGKTVKLNPWQPVRSNLVFIGVVLLAGCWYVYRQDF